MLLWLSARPVWALPVVTVVLLVAGLSAPPPIGVPVLLRARSCCWVWLSYLSWPVLDGGARVLRAAKLAARRRGGRQRVTAEPRANSRTANSRIPLTQWDRSVRARIVLRHTRRPSADDDTEDNSERHPDTTPPTTEGRRPGQAESTRQAHARAQAQRQVTPERGRSRDRRSSPARPRTSSPSPPRPSSEPPARSPPPCAGWSAASRRRSPRSPACPARSTPTSGAQRPACRGDPSPAAPGRPALGRRGRQPQRVPRHLDPAAAAAGRGGLPRPHLRRLTQRTTEGRGPRLLALRRGQPYSRAGKCSSIDRQRGVGDCRAGRPAAPGRRPPRPARRGAEPLRQLGPRPFSGAPARRRGAQGDTARPRTRGSRRARAAVRHSASALTGRTSSGTAFGSAPP